MNEKNVIVGFGWVGQANALALASMGYSVVGYDPGDPPLHYPEYAEQYRHIERIGDPKALDSSNTWYIVCVGDRVSEEGVQDISSISRALEGFADVQGGVILRSTILPDSLAALKFDYYLPEFLHEKKAVEECINPYIFVVGRNKNTHRREPSFFKLWRERAHKSFNGTPEEAAYIKYLSNLWNALRIAFVNEFGDAIGWPSTKEELRRIERIMGFLFDHRSYLRYGRAFGGHCLPKDSRAFIGQFGKTRDLPLLSAMYRANSGHQELQDSFPLMPEWHSEWPDRHIGGTRAVSELGYAIRKRVARLFS